MGSPMPPDFSDVTREAAVIRANSRFSVRLASRDLPSTRKALRNVRRVSHSRRRPLYFPVDSDATECKEFAVEDPGLHETGAAEGRATEAKRNRRLDSRRCVL